MDIVERLREWKNSPLFNWADLDPSDMEEAADEIERLRKKFGVDAISEADVDTKGGDIVRTAIKEEDWIETRDGMEA